MYSGEQQLDDCGSVTENVLFYREGRAASTAG